MKNLVFLSVVVLNLDCVFGMDLPAAWFHGNNQVQVVVLREENATRMEDLQRQITALREENARLTKMIEDQRTMALNVQRKLDEVRGNSKSEIEDLMRKHQTEIEKMTREYNILAMPDLVDINIVTPANSGSIFRSILEELEKLGESKETIQAHKNYWFQRGRWTGTLNFSGHCYVIKLPEFKEYLGKLNGRINQLRTGADSI